MRVLLVCEIQTIYVDLPSNYLYVSKYLTTYNLYFLHGCYVTHFILLK